MLWCSPPPSSPPRTKQRQFFQPAPQRRQLWVNHLIKVTLQLLACYSSSALFKGIVQPFSSWCSWKVGKLPKGKSPSPRILGIAEDPEPMQRPRPCHPPLPLQTAVPADPPVPVLPPGSGARRHPGDNGNLLGPVHTPPFTHCFALEAPCAEPVPLKKGPPYHPPWPCSGERKRREGHHSWDALLCMKCIISRGSEGAFKECCVHLTWAIVSEGSSKDLSLTCGREHLEIQPMFPLLAGLKGSWPPLFFLFSSEVEWNSSGKH